MTKEALLLLKVGRFAQITGGAVTMGFGMWRFIVPSLCDWWRYFDDDPEELRRAVTPAAWKGSSGQIRVEKETTFSGRIAP